MNNVQKIGRIEAIALHLAIICNNVIFNITSIIFNTSGSASWLNILYISFLAIIFMLLVLKLLKPFLSLNLLDISNYLGGKFLKRIMAGLYILMFVALTSIYLRYYVNGLHLIYFPRYSLLAIALLTFVPVIIASRTGLKAIYGTNLFVIPITILSSILLFSISNKNFSWQNFCPIFGYGAKELFINQSMNIFSFNIIGYMFFLPPFLKKENEFKKISIITLIIAGLYYLLTVIALTMTFAYSFQTDETFSLYLIARLATLGRFFERIDAIFFFVWILAFLSFLSFNIYIISILIKQSCNLADSKELIYSICSIIIGICFTFKNMAAASSFTVSFYKPFTVILIFAISFLVVLLANLKKKRSS